MPGIRNTLSESNDIANLLSLALENLNYSNEQIIRYSFLIEEALLKWKNHGISESQLCFARFERKNEIVFRWSIAGERCDPFSIDTDMVDTDPVVRMNDLLQSGVGTELKYKYRSREFWCKGYYVDTTGKNTSRIAEYIRNQLKEDEMGEQLRIPSASPFTGSK